MKTEKKRRRRWTQEEGFWLKNVNSDYDERDILIVVKKDFYEPSIFRPIKHGQVKDVYEDLVFFFSIIEDLNLNTRMWGRGEHSDCIQAIPGND